MAKPPIKIDSVDWIESKIRQAREEGLLDDLPGQGQPLPDLDEASDPLWWPKKLMQRERLVAPAPPALEMKRKVEALLEGLPRMHREADACEAIEALNEEIRMLNSKAHAGPPTRQAPLNVPRLLREWREARRDGGDS